MKSYIEKGVSVNCCISFDCGVCCSTIDSAGTYYVTIANPPTGIKMVDSKDFVRLAFDDKKTRDKLVDVLSIRNMICTVYIYDDRAELIPYCLERQKNKTIQPYYVFEYKKNQ